MPPTTGTLPGANPIPGMVLPGLAQELRTRVPYIEEDLRRYEELVPRLERTRDALERQIRANPAPTEDDWRELQRVNSDIQFFRELNGSLRQELEYVNRVLQALWP